MSANGYRVQFSSSDCLLRSGTKSYWHIDFASLLRAVNSTKSVNEVIFPEPLQESGGNTVTFALTDADGNEVLKKSVSLRNKVIPRSCLKKLQAAIDQMHKWADDSQVPIEKREFLRSFCLPDPKKDPDAYRMSGGPFSRKLHVLWGYEKVGSKSFLPKSKISEKWDDATSRKDIFTMCKCGILRSIFRPGNVLLALFISAIVYFGCFFPFECRCPVHNCVVAKGAYNYIDVEKRCPKRCVLAGCNRHLNDKENCNAHVCKKCKKVNPVSNGQDGVCDDCFWTIK